MTRLMTTAAVLTLFAGAAAANQDMMKDNMAKAMIKIEGVEISGDTAIFPTVMAEQDGYLVIHATLDGKPVAPASIGNVAVKAGENIDVEVKIDDDFTAGETYVAMLHAETNGNATYEFGEGMADVDTPVMVDGKPVVQSFEG